MFAVSLLRANVIQRNNVQGIKALNIVVPVGHEHNAPADSYKIRVLHIDSPPIGQANPERHEGRLVQTVTNGFCIQHFVPV